MARYNRPNLIHQVVVLACGASDANNPVDIVVPGPNATLLQIAATQKTAGTGTGTFGVQATYGGTPTVIGPASATTFIDADGAAGVNHGQVAVNAQVQNQEGARLGIKTVKAGTVSGNATVIFTLTWQL